MYCNAKLYKGNEPYIFFSYCHKDAELVYPVIEKLAAEGFRIWYDVGINPGDNWIEIIGERLENARFCIVAITPNSAASHSCRNEINFCVENNKKFVPILFEKFAMSAGVRLQNSSSQQIKKYELPNEREFYKKIYEIAGIEECREKDFLLNNRKTIEDEFETKKEATRKEKVFKKAKDILSFVNRMPNKAVNTEIEKTEVKTISNQQEIDWDDDNENSTVIEDSTVIMDVRTKQKLEQAERKAVFVCLSTKEVYPLKKMSTKIGRDKKQCDIVLEKDTISSLHATIFYNNAQEYYIRDEDSSNGTMLNNEELSGLEPVHLNSGELLYLANELCMFAVDELANYIMEHKQCALLQCEETEEIRLLTLENMYLGRADAWEGGTFQDNRTSRKHAVIYQQNGKYILEIAPKETPKGTFRNEEYLQPGETVELKDGDEISIGKIYHIKFHSISLNEKIEK